MRASRSLVDYWLKQAVIAFVVRLQRYPAADHSSPLVIRCTYHNWAGDDDDDGGPDFEQFMRAELALCLILLLLMAIGTGFSIYSLLHPRCVYTAIVRTQSGTLSESLLDTSASLAGQ